MTAFVPFNPTSQDVRPFVAELCLIGGIAANLLLPFITRRPNFICAGATLATLMFAVISLLTIGHGAPAGAPGSVMSGPHLRGLLMFDSLAYFWKLILLFFVAGVVLIWFDQSGRSLRQGDAPEFFVLLLGATLGMCLMASTTHLLMIFLAVALASLPSYLLAGFAKQSKSGAEASLKYVLFGAVTGAIMIYGISFLYGIYGTLQLTDLVSRAPTAGQSAALSVGVIGLLIGIGFKISAVPLHFWCPDVFEGSSIEVTTFLSVASKGAALILLLRVVQLIGGTHLGLLVGVTGAITATVGNLAAFKQTNIKRLLAYSSIAQAGYMMCVISAAGNADESTSGLIGQALLMYLVIYAVMNLGAFAVTAAVIRQSGEQIDAFAGLGRTSPLLAGSMFCCLISLLGLPPFAGFGAKVNLLWVLAQADKAGKILAVVVVVNTVLSAFYYFGVIRLMYLEPGIPTQFANRMWTRNPVVAMLGASCAVGLIVMFLFFGPLYAATSGPTPRISTPMTATAWGVPLIKSEKS